MRRESVVGLVGRPTGARESGKWQGRVGLAKCVHNAAHVKHGNGSAQLS